ncbi:M1 family metallopeptidase [Mucilaginibacter gossypii]|uniref:M1 family metallopeptidase n=1 Tax=Mucilaginibacter gossypii TaxID=551996 RepID=UPI000DCF5B26|nr:MULTISPECIES: M1 family metallopeptidase [Mucilaginibacter]QTE37333.1 M1 family metallopeptidase [Mucilaginibacter gossypii]RAV57286.1 M1 family peptidase [Mucilaginibacter rubeus]
MTKKTFTFIILSLLTCKLIAQQNDRQIKPTHQDTLKGSITPERTWWDVLRYDLTIKPDYINQTICGSNIIQYKIVKNKHTGLMQIDLQSPLKIDSIKTGNAKLSFIQNGDAWFVKPLQRSKNNVQNITIYYSGKPKQSVNPPWDGGLVWQKDSVGRPWMAVACQLPGASAWFPCKVYIGDKPDKGASVTIITPDTLVAVSNGRLQRQLKNTDGTSSYTWAVNNPINNYGLTFYIGKYEHVSEKFNGERGNLDLDFWVLDYNQEKVKGYLVAEVRKTLTSFEHWFGPYPFYSDGFKMVEAPYIGMEHQSAIGYGNKFRLGRFGLNPKRLTYWDQKTDRMVVHETAHEWFGNNITANDPAYGWLQEGFAGYAEELAIADPYGPKASHDFFLSRTSNRIGNKAPVISPDNIFKDGGEDAYLKGWVLIHMLQAIINNDDKFREVLRALNRSFYHQSVNSTQIENHISKVSKKDLSKIFDQYLRTTQIPILEYKIDGKSFEYRFTNCIAGFTMPVKIKLIDQRWIAPSTNWQSLKLEYLPTVDSLAIDPDFYIQAKIVK